VLAQVVIRILVQRNVYNAQLAVINVELMALVLNVMEFRIRQILE
jgi:hypothetical protein